MKETIARCSCGQLRLETEGDPVARSVCHCLECQRRTGSVFGAQSRFRNEQLKLTGEPHEFIRQGDTGASVTFFFCPRCATTLFWKPEKLPGFTMVAMGAFANPEFGPPDYSVYETRQHKWVALDGEMDHYD